MTRIVAAFSAFLLAWTLAFAEIDDPAGFIDQVLNPSLDAAAAAFVDDLHIDLGAAELRFHEGWLVPGQPIAGHPAEMVFVGEAHCYLEPPDAVEALQLRMFTGNDVLNAPVDQAVLVLTDGEIVSQ